MATEGSKKRYFILAGGLGNQLFQLAAALSLAKDANIEMRSFLNNSRLNNDGIPEISSFKLPSQVEISNKIHGDLIVKLTSAAIALGVKNGSKRLDKLVEKCLLPISSVAFSINLKKFVIPTSINGVGYDNTYKDKFFKIPIGYLQSYRWHRDGGIKKILMQLEPLNYDKRISKYRLLSKEENPIIVHYRFGDYVGNESFGRPSPDFYSTSLELLTQDSKSKIWVFSDDINKAKYEFPIAFKNSVRWIEDLDDSVAATFEVMRLGSSYVIANSTFSWWAAFLNYKQSNCVIAPAPWFKQMPEPVDICPSEWLRISAKYEG
jgi:hypothetical protein